MRPSLVRLVLSLCCIAAMQTVNAQKEFLDSLRKRILREKSDTEVVRLHVQLGNLLRTNDTADAWRQYRSIDSIAVKTGKDYFAGQAHFLAATIELDRNQNKSIGNFERAIRIFSKYPDNKKILLSLAASYLNLGLVHHSIYDYQSAIASYLKAEEVYLKADPRNADIAILYGNLGITYGSANQNENAFIYCKKALDWARKANDQRTLMNGLYSYGAALSNIKKSPECLAVLDSAKAIAIKINDVYIEYSSDFQKAAYYYYSKQYQKALEQYTALLQMARKFNVPQAIGSNFINMAGNELELKMPKLAIAHLDSSAKYIDYTLPTQMKQMYFENYAEAYRQTGNYDKAFAFKDSMAVVKDSLYSAEKIKEIEFRQATYNYGKQQAEISKLEDEKQLQAYAIRQKNTLNYILVGSAAALLLLFLLLIRLYQQRKKIDRQRIAELETEKKLAATEAVLKGEEQERSRLAKDLHDGLGGMLSGIKYSFQNMKGNLVMTPDNRLAFDRGMDMLDSSIKEMRRVAHNMMPEALVKFGLDTALRDFCNDINQSGALEVSYQSIGIDNAAVEQTTGIAIYRIVQELVNNTIKHASAKAAIVQVTKTDSMISITVEDDGKGFDPSILNAAKGIGWTNIQSRVEFLKGKMDVQSAPDKGTSVHIELTA